MQVIDSDNYAASGIETMFFPGGEPHVKCPLLKESTLLFLKLRDWGDVGIAACLIDALKRRKSGPQVISFIPYFPGARQDRITNLDLGKYPLTAHIIANILGTSSTTVTFDSHSSVLHQFMNIISIYPESLSIEIKKDVVGIIAPDAGATDRAEWFRDRFYPNTELIQYYKKRDAHTGVLSIDKDKMPIIPKKGRYIIVDDICDGGGTFNLLAEQFFACPISVYCNLELFVSHGIFSKGLKAIDKRISHITTTNSWCSPDIYEHNIYNKVRLTILPLEQLFLVIERMFK